MMPTGESKQEVRLQRTARTLKLLGLAVANSHRTVHPQCPTESDIVAGRRPRRKAWLHQTEMDPLRRLRFRLCVALKMKPTCRLGAPPAFPCSTFRIQLVSRRGTRPLVR